MGEKSEILDSLTKMSTGTLLACILALQVYFNWENDRQWNQRMGTVFERQAAAAEKMVEISTRNTNLLVEILKARTNDK